MKNKFYKIVSKVHEKKNSFAEVEEEVHWLPVLGYIFISSCLLMCKIEIVKLVIFAKIKRDSTLQECIVVILEKYILLKIK